MNVDLEVTLYDEVGGVVAQSNPVDDTYARIVTSVSGGRYVLAIDGVCPHVGGPLGEGFVEDGKVYCPLHGWPFDLKTGRCATNKRATVECFQTKVEDGVVFVRTQK